MWLPRHSDVIVMRRRACFSRFVPACARHVVRLASKLLQQLTASRRNVFWWRVAEASKWRFVGDSPVVATCAWVDVTRAMSRACVVIMSIIIILYFKCVSKGFLCFVIAFFSICRPTVLWLLLRHFTVKRLGTPWRTVSHLCFSHILICMRIREDGCYWDSFAFLLFVDLINWVDCVQLVCWLYGGF